MLDIKSANKGILMPRVALTGTTDAVTVPTPAVSLMVYNTATAGGVTPGYYYNSGTTGSPVWTRVATGTGLTTGTGVATRVAFWDSPTNLSSNANLYWDNTNARLGVGTATPGAKFSVLKNDHTTYTDFSEIARFENSTTDYPTYKHGLSVFSTGDAAGARLGSNVLTTTTTDVTKDYTSRSSGILGILNTSSDGSVFNFLTAPVGSNTLTSRMYIASNGNVGIGTTAPVVKLHVDGSIVIPSFETATNVLSFRSGLPDGTNVGIRASNVGGTGNRDGLELFGYNGINFSTNNGATIAMHISGVAQTNGNVGIGTTAPGYKLDVNGNIGTNYGSLILNPSGGTVGTDGTYGVYWHQSSGTPDATYGIYRTAGAWNSPNYQQLKMSFNTGIIIDGGTAYGRSGTFLQPSGGNVGIGTMTPSFKLHVPSGYIGTDYINTSDNSVTSGVTGVMVKQGDNFFRTATAGALGTFLSGVFIPNNGSGDWQIASSSTSTAYSNASLELRESNFSGAGGTSPRLSFHHAGVVASQIGLESSGRIAILNNPGTAYEALVASNITSTQWLRNSQSGYGLYNDALDNYFYAVNDNDWMIRGSGTNCGLQFSNGTTTYGYYYGDGGGVGILNSNRAWALQNPAGTTNINVVGRLGVGTASPAFPLDVRGSANYTFIGTSLMNAGPNYSFVTSGTNNLGSFAFSIRAESGVLASYYYATSDARVKKVIGVTNGLTDLNTINKIKITNYHYIDTIAEGNRTSKKVIAQELEQVYPEAVSTTTNFIPNVYQVAKNVTFVNNTLSVSITKPHECVVGDIIKMYVGSQSKELKVLSVTNINTFAVEWTEKQPEALFVYGKQVNDFKVVDYEALTTLNISATQELQKIVSAQQTSIAAQQAQIDELKKLVETLLKK
jgi:hypothetical protein